VPVSSRNDGRPKQTSLAAAQLNAVVRRRSSQVTDWRRNQDLLCKDSERLIRALFAEHEKRREPLAAIGYVYEFGRGQLCFELCANTARHARTSIAEYHEKYPDTPADEFRWNSGDYDDSGAADQYGGGWSESWWEELQRLDRLAADDEESKCVHEAVARICCNVLAELAGRGVLGNWRRLDFNVAALLDEVAEVKERDRRIRRLIESSAEPGSAADRGRM